jgi:hypothetical protein
MYYMYYETIYMTYKTRHGYIIKHKILKCYLYITYILYCIIYYDT